MKRGKAKNSLKRKKNKLTKLSQKKWPQLQGCLGPRDANNLDRCIKYRLYELLILVRKQVVKDFRLKN